MFNQSQPMSFWIVAITVVAVVVLIYAGIAFVKLKQNKERE